MIDRVTFRRRNTEPNRVIVMFFSAFVSQSPDSTGRSTERTVADVVELPLLLPKERAEELLRLSKRRNQSVAQILRNLVDQALIANPE